MILPNGYNGRRVRKLVANGTILLNLWPNSVKSFPEAYPNLGPIYLAFSVRVNSEGFSANYLIFSPDKDSSQSRHNH